MYWPTFGSSKFGNSVIFTFHSKFHFMAGIRDHKYMPVSVKQSKDIKCRIYIYMKRWFCGISKQALNRVPIKSYFRVQGDSVGQGQNLAWPCSTGKLIDLLCVKARNSEFSFKRGHDSGPGHKPLMVITASKCKKRATWFTARADGHLH